MKGIRKNRTNQQQKARKVQKKSQKGISKLDYKLGKKQLRFKKFQEKQKTKRLQILPETLKAGGQALAIGSSPTASAIGAAKIANTTPNSNRNSDQMANLINPTDIATTSNEEEEYTLKGGYEIR